MTTWGYGGSGRGPGGVLPASSAQGDILQGDGAGTWESAGAAPVVGDRLRFDGTDWVPFQDAEVALGWGCSGVINLTSFLYTWNAVTNSNAADNRRIMFAWPVLVDSAVLIHNAVAGAANITYTLMSGGVATALALTLSSGAAGPVSDLVTQVTIPALTGISVRAVQNSGGTLTVVPALTMRLRRV